MKLQGGGFAMGLVAGVLLGLALALGVALYITKVPVPFIDKVPQRTAEMDTVEAERNKTWDPNAPLLAKDAPRPAGAAESGAPIIAAPPVSDPAAAVTGTTPEPLPAAVTPAIVASTKPSADPFTYFVQVGAYRRAEDAEAQRAQLGMQGLTARVTEREQAGRTVYRVRLGPFPVKADADNAQQRLASAGLDGQLVRVQKP